MNLTIEALNPNNAQTYVDYLDHLDFHHAPDWAGCFCRFYHTTCTNQEWEKRTGNQNKADALQAISNGSMKGFLAFHEGQCVGWINANAVQSYPRLTDFVKPYINAPQTGCIVCFVIHPAYRRQGIASALLSAAVDDFKQNGFDAILAYPFENKDEPEKAYRGSSTMYTNLGFEVLEARNGMAVMRKELKQ